MSGGNDHGQRAGHVQAGDAHVPAGDAVEEARLVARDEVARGDALRGDALREEQVLEVVEESLSLGKRVEITGRVRISTPVDVVEEVLRGEVERVDVEVERVPVGREVDAVPEARVEGDVTVLPVVEERLVVVRRLVLVEEVRVRRRASTRLVEQPAERRVQRVVVERLPGEAGATAVALDEAPAGGARPLGAAG